VFAHPDRSRIEGRVGRLARGETTPEDRAEFVAVAAAASPGRLDVDPERYERARETVLDTVSWVGEAVGEWGERARTDPPEPSLGAVVEGARGAPETPGWTDGREES